MATPERREKSSRPLRHPWRIDRAAESMGRDCYHGRRLRSMQGPDSKKQKNGRSEPRSVGQGRLGACAILTMHHAPRVLRVVVNCGAVERAEIRRANFLSD
jgi:hypothetical protein